MIFDFRLCHLCIGKVPGGKCTQADPYVGFEGAFRCLLEAGEIAFLKHTSVKEMIDSKLFKGVSTDQFQLLCKNGQRMPVSDHLQCNWGMVPSNAIVTSSARTSKDRKRYQNFLMSAIKLYSHKSTSNSTSSNDRFNINNNNNNNRFDNRNQNDRNNNNDRTNRQRYDDPFGSSSTIRPMNDSQMFESFEMFDSSRYGKKLNLMFQVSYFK